MNTVSLVILFSLHTLFNTISIAAMATNQSLWTPQGRRYLPIFKVWRPWMALFSFVVGHLVGYLISEWRDTSWPRRSPWVFLTQAFHFDIAVYLIAMILPGKSLQKPSPDHTSGPLDLHTAGFIAMLASATTLSWMYYYAFHFISPNDVSHWQNTGGGALLTLLVVTIMPVWITLPVFKTPFYRQGLKYLVFEYTAFVLSLLERIPYLGAIFCDCAEKFRRQAHQHLFEFLPIEEMDTIRLF